MGIMFDEGDVLYATTYIEDSPLFIIDTGTGVATAQVNPGMNFPHGGAINTTPQVGNIYTTHGFGQNLGVLNTLTGKFSNVGNYGLPEATGMSATAFSPDGTLFGMLQGFFHRGGMSQLMRIDTQSGKAMPVGFANAINAVSFDFTADGIAYVAGFSEPEMGMKGNTVLYSLNTANGQLTAIGDTGVDRIMDFAFDSSGTMWATTANELYVIDLGTGASEHVASITGVESATDDPHAEVMGIMFGDDGLLYGTAYIENSPLFTIDTATGIADVVASPVMSFPHGGAMKSATH